MDLKINQWKVLREIHHKGKTGNHPGILAKLREKGLITDWLGGPDTTKKGAELIRKKYGI